MQILNTLFDVNSTTVIEESGDFNYEFNLMHFTQQLLLLKEYNNMTQQNLTVELYIPFHTIKKQIEYNTLEFKLLCKYEAT